MLAATRRPVLESAGQLPANFVVRSDVERNGRQRREWLGGALMLTVVGYQVYGRAFSYLGLIQQQVFVGEILLAVLIVSRRSAIIERWLGCLLKPHRLNGVALGFLVFLAWGSFELVRGWTDGWPKGDILKEFAFNFYPLYIFAGLWAGLTQPRFLYLATRISAWAVGLYGMAYVLFLGRFHDLYVPGTLNVDLFNQPGCGIAILGLLALSTRMISAGIPLLLLVLVMLGTMVRAEWLGVFCALIVWSVLAKKFARFLACLVTLGFLLWIAAITNFSMPAPSGRGGVISAKALLSRFSAPIDETFAAEYSNDSRTYAGTYEFRTAWWAEIWNGLQDSPTLLMTGYGYGYPLYRFLPFDIANKETIRTPHSWIYYCLGYTGCTGLLIFVAFQLTLGSALFRAAKKQRQYYGLMIWVFALSMGAFGGLFETPYGAIPVYVMVGAALGSDLVVKPVRRAGTFPPGAPSAAGSPSFCEGSKRESDALAPQF